MLFSCILSVMVAVAEPTTTWHDSYDKATDVALKENKDLVIYFSAKGELDEALAKAIQLLT